MHEPHSLMEQVPWEENIAWSSQPREKVHRPSEMLDFEASARKFAEEQRATEEDLHFLDFDLINLYELYHIPV
jgi:hypothetical protein